jgi:hypothetical protein
MTYAVTLIIIIKGLLLTFIYIYGFNDNQCLQFQAALSAYGYRAETPDSCNHGTNCTSNCVSSHLLDKEKDENSMELGSDDEAQDPSFDVDDVDDEEDEDPLVNLIIIFKKN